MQVSQHTSLSALLLGQMMIDAGFPPGTPHTARVAQCPNQRGFFSFCRAARLALHARQAGHRRTALQPTRVGDATRCIISLAGSAKDVHHTPSCSLHNIRTLSHCLNMCHVHYLMHGNISGVVNILTGEGKGVGEILVSHPDVDKVRAVNTACLHLSLSHKYQWTLVQPSVLTVPSW